MNSRYLKYGILITVCIWFLQSCYKDLGNYNYNTSVATSISVDTTDLVGTFKVNMGEKLYKAGSSQTQPTEINPAITYDGNSTDLAYEWQIWNANVSKFVLLHEGKNLSEYIWTPNVAISAIMPVNTYKLRLAVTNMKALVSDTDNETNKTFSRVIDVTVNNTFGEESILEGLMVLHSDGESSDIGIIATDEFTYFDDGNKNVVDPTYYSRVNSARIPGVGKQIAKRSYLRSNPRYNPDSSNPAHHIRFYGNGAIYIYTSQGSYVADYFYLQKELGTDYRKMFIADGLGFNKPQSYQTYDASYLEAIVDDGHFFYQSSGGGPFTSYYVNTTFNYYAAPQFVIVGGDNGIGAVFFDNLSKSFMVAAGSYYGGGISRLPNNANSTVGFNPAAMKAELIHFEKRSYYMPWGHPASTSIAVMKDDATNNLYLAEFDFDENSERERVAYRRKDMQHLPEINNAKFFSFGLIREAAYYATEGKLYQYRYDNTANDALLAVSYADFGEKVTMMKIFKEEGWDNAYNSNKLVLVGTLDASNNGKLYVYDIHPTNGTLSLKNTYTGFGHIDDVVLKHNVY
ncbi:PKD-like family lipoprotein [Sphingobacterium bambusae]|uniref:PKD-like family lipoprotein n=1 Tax=Sphingobacterium bambusae TaxID=662858 RepID=A0ABW6BKG6_9SPHI|nr:PKD-like family lipoprotein [Sphingobacterium bambusae]WPL49433.1 PKD-like family lipoprotein [Sphingobacterium bambusae]